MSYIHSQSNENLLNTKYCILTIDGKRVTVNQTINSGSIFIEPLAGVTITPTPRIKNATTSLNQNFSTSDGIKWGFYLSPNTSYTTITVGSTGTPLPTKPIVLYSSQTTIGYLNSKYCKGFNGSTAITLDTKFYQDDTFTIKSNAGYTIISAEITNTNGSTQQFTINSDKNQADLKLDIESLYNASSLNVVTKTAPLFTFSQENFNSFIEKGVKLYADNLEVQVGHEFRQGDLVTAIVEPERDFYTNYNDMGVDFLSVGFTDLSVLTYRTFHIDPNNPKKASGNVGQNSDGFYVDTVYAPPKDVRGFNNVYLVSSEQLKEITKKRFVEKFQDIETGGQKILVNEVVEDFGKYMLGLIEIPFKVKPNYIVGKQTVKLSTLDTGISADLLNTDVINVFMGEIFTPATNSNFTDYINTTVILHLPYSQSINLDLDYVMNEKISIYYRINLYDGVTQINIHSTKINSVVLSQNVDLGVTIPYANLDTMPKNNDPRNIDLGGKNSVQSPFIEILRNDPLLVDSLFNLSVTDEDTLIDHKGFIKVENIDLQCSATSSEKDAILIALTDGILIR